MKNNLGLGTICVHDNKSTANTTPHQLPIYATSSFEFASVEQGIGIFQGKEQGHIYGRFGNPTIDVVQDKLAALETYGLEMEAYCLMTSSGMSAISTLVMTALNAGDKILTQGNLYGGTTELFTQVLGALGIEPIFINLQDQEEVERQLKAEPSIKMVYFETPANPTLACVDIQILSDLAHAHGCISVADSTFCTPYVQQPFKFGADFVIHSTTKYLNGHGNSIAGALIGKNEEFMKSKVWKTMKLAGTNCNPWDAWLTNNGLKTLALRMERHCQNATLIAQFLEWHPSVEKVNYCGLDSHPDHILAKKQMKRFGGMISFELKGGFEAGFDFMNKVQLCTLAPTLGDVDTLILHPASSSHLNVPKEIRMQNGITDGLVRISVGIEEVEDIISDLRQAL